MLPKPTNRPRAEIVALAEDAMRRQGVAPGCVRVFYKFDCALCGSRQRTLEADVLPESSPCLECGHVTVITAAGFQLQIRPNTRIDWDEVGNPLLLRPRYKNDRDRL